MLYKQVVKVVDITTLNNRQYCVICDPIGADGKPQLGGKKLVKVTHLFLKSYCRTCGSSDRNSKFSRVLSIGKFIF